MAPAVLANPQATANTNVEAEAPRVSIPRLMPEQVQRLMSLIDTSKNGSDKLTGKSLWMLESAAPTHMTGDANLLSKTENMWPVLIELPNSAQIVTTNQGTVAWMMELIKRCATSP